MTNPGGQLWVNPEGVVSVGDAYAQEMALYDQYLSQLASLRARGQAAWGDDDMGKEFSEKFLQGMDNLESLIGSVRGTLKYTSEGLRESGLLYRQVDDEAHEVGEKMSRDFDENLSQMPLARTRAAARVTEPAQEAAFSPLLPAEEGTPKLRRAMAVEGKRLEPTGFTASRVRAEGEPIEPMQPLMARRLAVARPVEGEVTEPLVAGRLANARPVEGEVTEPLMTRQLANARVTEGETTEPQTFVRAERRMGKLIEAEPGIPTEEATPMLRGRLAQGRTIEPMEALQPTIPGVPASPVEPGIPAQFSAATPAMPAISSYMMKPEYATAYVGGQPLPEGYRLEALNTFEDGTSRVDANLYESITPLAGTPVTAADGTPLDPEGRHFFVVKENPAADATAPGYQPLILSYTADGTPNPLF
ncbi:hypothetical protein [Symbioplanes lichenis]|uniref:hypothetical protein n=1 Tax=Symbioplanes lichenis TaxID=1629072 RepID=UPI002738936A|nr:hypothetical protein [Actinoplanes lichenis]